MRIESCELFKLHRCSAHHEAVAIICIFFYRRRIPQGSVPFVIFEHCLISEGERIAIEVEIGRSGADARRGESSDCAKPPNNPRPAPSANHHVKNHSRRRRFCLRRRLQAVEIFDIVFPIVRQLEPEKSAGEHGAALCQHRRRSNHGRGAHRPPAQG